MNKYVFYVVVFFTAAFGLIGGFYGGIFTCSRMHQVVYIPVEHGVPLPYEWDR